MFGSFPNRAATYAKVGVETGVNTADPHTLILMLFDGAILSIRTASAALEKKDVAVKGQSVSKAIDIIVNGLKASLDQEAGGELAARLAALYDYMSERLLYANLHNNAAALTEVASLLQSLQEAWQGISPHNTTATATSRGG